MRILVAEDDPVAAALLLRDLEELGHEPVWTKNGALAWEQLQHESFPVVITDWMMPEMDGLELCRRVRSLWNLGYVYTIVVSSRSDITGRDEALRASVDDFLIKPVRRLDLRARLACATRILQMQRQLEEQNEDLARSREELTSKNLELERREKLLRQANSIAEMARNRFSQLFDSLPVAGFTFDQSGTVFEWNDRAAEIFFAPGHVAMGRKVWEILGLELVNEKARDQLERVFAGHVFEEQDWNDGDLFLLVSGHPLFGPDGHINGAVATAVDVSLLRKAEVRIEQQNALLVEANRKLAELATTDGLTGIPNHRAFQERVSHYVAMHRRGRPFCLAVLDVDHFKLFNDRFGHQAGDEVLVLVARTLRDSLREVDFVARYGGEEFCALLDDLDSGRAVVLCNRLRERIAAIQNPYQQITVSIGVCEFDASMDGGYGLVQVADAALYRAKEAGRNQVSLGVIEERRAA